MVVRFLEWIMNQNEAFYWNKNSLWNQLFQHELAMTQEQMQRLTLSQPKFHAVTQRRQDLIDRINPILRGFREASLHVNFETDLITSIFTEQQLIKLLQWLDQYGSACF